MRLMFKLSITFLLLGSLSSLCAEPLYQVEVIAFNQTDGTGLNSEIWPAQPILPDLDKTMLLVPATEPLEPYQILPPTLWQLGNIDEKINTKPNTQVILHTAWLQPMTVPAKAAFVQLVADMSKPTETDEADQALVKTVEPIGLTDGSDWQFNGTIRVSKPYLFQVDLNAVLTLSPALIEKYSPKAADNLKTNQFVLNQTIRVKLGDVYYIDHPLFGILIEINKYTAPATTATTP